MTKEQLKLYQKVCEAENKTYIYFQKMNFKKMEQWKTKAEQLRQEFNKETEKTDCESA